MPNPNIYAIIYKESKEVVKMDFALILLVIFIVVVAIFFKDFKSVVYFLGIIEIFFRLTHRIALLIKIKDFTKLVDKYIPYSLEGVINTYSSGILNTILIWVLILLFIYFEYYLVKYWVSKKK